MKAIRIHDFGGAEVLQYEDVPELAPGADDIRIRIVAAGVNPADWKIRKNGLGMALPMTMGLDVAGVVDRVGSNVRAFKAGNRVFAKVTSEQGGYAEYTVVEESQAAKMPERIGFVEAAAVPTAGLTAWQALFDYAALQSGQTVLIHGAAGGVGSFAVQFAKWKGAYVIGTASGDHFDFVKRLGADEVIDYTEIPFEQVACSMDVVLDTVGGDTLARSWGVLKPGGFLVTLVARFSDDEPAKYGVRGAHPVTRGDGNELALIAALIDQGVVTPMVTTVLPLSEARRAHELSESQHMKGKIVLQVAEEPVTWMGEMAA